MRSRLERAGVEDGTAWKRPKLASVDPLQQPEIRRPMRLSWSSMDRELTSLLSYAPTPPPDAEAFEAPLLRCGLLGVIHGGAGSRAVLLPPTPGTSRLFPRSLSSEAVPAYGLLAYDPGSSISKINDTTLMYVQDNNCDESPLK